ncbi:MAG: HupE/UreJ family protein [Marinifilaceae bacterium]
MNTLLHFLENAVFYLFSLKALDHILFLTVFGMVFQLREWKGLLLLWCALAVGFTISLFLAAYGVINFNYGLTRLLLASCIFLGAFTGLIHKGQSTPNALRYNLTVLMGLIQGLGFAIRYKSIAKVNFLSLLGFDLGLWIASLLIILLALCLSSLIILAFRTNRRDFNLIFSGIGLGVALVLLFIRY